MAAYSYEYKMPGLIKAPAEVAGEICQRLSESEAGLTPATLLDASRDADSPLHNEFEWRDNVAAEKYRLQQAQKIILNLRIKVERQDGTVESERGFVITPGGKSAYVTLSAALSNEKWRQNLLAQAKEEMMIFMSKYRRLEELAEVNTAIQDYLDQKAG